MTEIAGSIPVGLIKKMDIKEFEKIEREFIKDTEVIEKDFNKIVNGTNWID